MHKLMVTAGAAALLAASSLVALAAQATGAIASLDASVGTVTLDNGQTFMLPGSIDAASLQIGDRVSVTYEENANGEITATTITPAQQ
jgi:uncharacterized OB-fold protein